MPKKSLCALAALVGSIACISSAFAQDYNMAGPVMGGFLVTGAKAGLGDATQTISTSLNNQYLIEIAIMFIGLAVIMGLIMSILRGHRRLGGGGRYASDSYPGMGRKQKAEWDWLDDHGMPK